MIVIFTYKLLIVFLVEICNLFTLMILSNKEHLNTTFAGMTDDENIIPTAATYYSLSLILLATA